MKRLLLGLLLLMPTATAQTYAKIEVSPQLTLLVLWANETPIVFQQGFGPMQLGERKADPDHLKAQYVTQEGTLITVYIDCTKRTSEACLALFKKRYGQMVKFLPIDKEATAKWLGIK